MAKKRIFACISEPTRELVVQYAEMHGVKTGYLVEQALVHYLQALRELPFDVVIPRRVMVNPSSLNSYWRLA